MTTFICASFNLWDAVVDDSALHSRGWVVQELVLAPRVLYFGDLSERSAKPDEDKLVAISGLARKLIIDGDQYVAGLWREILPYELMWSTDSEIKLLTYNTCIPSWSWASINKPIFPRAYDDYGESSILIRVIEAEVSLVGNDPSGQISGGVLYLEGPLIKTTIRRCIGRYSNKKWWLGATSLATVFADRGHFSDGSTIFCLTIESKNHSDEISKCGIILEPTNAAPGRFYRRGYFAVFDLVSGDSYVRDFDELYESVLEPQYYEEALGVDLKAQLPFYRFSIV